MRAIPRRLVFRVAMTLALLGGATPWAASPAGAADETRGDDGTRTLQIGIHRVRAEVVDSETTRERGLMWRRSLGRNDGMLFVFPGDERYCFWMKNTLIPLSIAFIDRDGRIVNVDDMQPQTEESHCPRRSIAYALEMNQGWFATRGLDAGAAVSGLPGR